MAEALIAVAALVVGFGLGFLVRGRQRPMQVRRGKKGERRSAPRAVDGSAPRGRGKSEPTELSELLDGVENSLAEASESLADARVRWLEEGDEITTAGRTALGRFDADVVALEECLDRLETQVSADDPAHARLDAALNELFAAARRLAPFGQNEEADARDRAALEAHEHRFATARADFTDAADELRRRS